MPAHIVERFAPGLNLRLRVYKVPSVKPLIYIQNEGTEAGPYDLVQLASLLRKNVIDPQTQTRLEGEDAWMPFSWQPQYSVVREIPANAVSSRVDELNEAAADARRPIFPMPSRETMINLAGMLAGCICAALIAYIFARLDATTGYCVIAAGLGMALVAHCLIIARLLDENYWTLGLVFFVPGGDLYYFISNFWKYFPLYCLKYGGIALFIGASAGLGRH